MAINLKRFQEQSRYVVEVRECWIRRYVRVLAHSKKAACMQVKRALEDQVVDVSLLNDVGPNTMEFNNIIGIKAKRENDGAAKMSLSPSTTRPPD